MDQGQWIAFCDPLPELSLSLSLSDRILIYFVSSRILDNVKCVLSILTSGIFQTHHGQVYKTAHCMVSYTMNNT